MKSFTMKQFGFGIFCLSLIHHVFGQRAIDTVQVGSNKYFFSDTTPYSPTLNWFLSFQYCRNIGMDLLSFQTNEEFEEVSLYLENNGKSINNYWTSGNQLGSNMWMWMTTGQPFNTTFSYWSQGGPPLTKSEKGCMEVQSSVWSAANCMDNNAFICQLTRCYYFDYAVTNKINSSQGNTSNESNFRNENKKLTNFNNDETPKTESGNQKQTQEFKPISKPVKLLQQPNFSPSNHFQNQQNQPLFHNPLNQEILPPNQANEIVPKQIPFLSREILPPLRKTEVGNSAPPRNPPTQTLDTNLGQLRRLRRKEEFSWAFA